MITIEKHVRFWIIPVMAILFLVFQGTNDAAAMKDASQKVEKAMKAPTKKGCCASKALGPQPEPPDKPDPGTKGLGPQPEPPDMPAPDSKGLSPQPEPPDRDIQVK